MYVRIGNNFQLQERPQAKIRQVYAQGKGIWSIE